MARVARLVPAVLFATGVVLATDDAVAAEAPPCAVWQIEYALAGTLHLTDTPFGKANGAHKVGPGRIVLRFERNGARVSILSYSMRQSFSVFISAFFSTMTIHAVSTTRATPDACGIAAVGVLKGSNVEWTSKVRAVHTDGTLTCEGKFCGSNGAPPPGSKPIQLGPEDTRVRPFEFSKDWRTFTMPFTLAAKTDVPKQTSFLALTGREVKRTCVPTPPACKR